MTKPTRYLTRMLVFLAAVVAVAAVLYRPLTVSFAANPYLNGLILVVLVIGIIYAFRQVVSLQPEVRWAQVQARDEDRATPAESPRLLAPVAALLASRGGSRLRMSALSLRSLLDGVAARLDEGREISRYFTSVLVFLGLLGTFYGLLITISEISGTISGLSVQGADVGGLFDALKEGLQGPLGGMGTAFSSSLFGLAGSLVLGFLDLQVGQAQNRFYTDVEDWLTSITRLTAAGGEDSAAAGGGAPDSYIVALVEQAADDMANVLRLLKKAETERIEANANMRALAEGIANLADQLRAQRGAAEKTADSQMEVQALLSRLVALEQAREPALDDAAQTHLRNLDLGVKALKDEQTRSAEAIAEAFRQEIKLLARALAHTRGERDQS
ncbi:MAG: flagellar motor protein MotA [Rhodothalassiaceae bacterium]